MSRVSPLCTLALVCGSLAVGCGKKDEESGGGGGGSFDGAPVVRSRSVEDKREAVARLRQIGLALHNFESSHGSFPAGVVGSKGQLGLSWRVAILPYIEQGALYKEFKLDEPWDSEHNKKLVAKMPPVFESPGVVLSYGKTYLRSFSGPSGFISGSPVGPKGPMFNPFANQPPGSPARGRPMSSMTDGTSNTFMVVEAAEPVEWTKPDELPFSDLVGNPSAPAPPLPKLGGLSDGGFYALFCDGSVRFIPKTVNEKTLRALISVNGGEVVSLDAPDDDRRPGAVNEHEPAKPPRESPPTKTKW